MKNLHRDVIKRIQKRTGLINSCWGKSVDKCVQDSDNSTAPDAKEGGKGRKTCKKWKEVHKYEQ